MRSRSWPGLGLAAAVALALAGCATAAQQKECFLVSSWAAPAFNCPAGAPPPEPVAEVKPEPEPEPEIEADPPEVDVQAERIELSEKVQFEPASAKLLPQSMTLLDEVAKSLADHPEIKKVRIEGHTDANLGRRYNKRLSERRAKAVKDYLVSKGVAARRLDSRGFGEDKPIADNGTREGREENRRVELKIVGRD